MSCTCSRSVRRTRSRTIFCAFNGGLGVLPPNKQMQECYDTCPACQYAPNLNWINMVPFLKTGLCRFENPRYLKRLIFSTT